MTLYLNTSPDDFDFFFGMARENSPAVAAATSDFEHVAGTTYWASPAGMSGYAVRNDGELVYVFSLERGRGAELVASAIHNGASHLDCFDGYLVTLYSHAGFAKVTSLPNWTDGEPDVVYMARPGCFALALSKAEGA